MSERDELVSIVGDGHFKPPAHVTSGPCCMRPEAIEQVADAILADGYRKPRTITTAEELDALGRGSVIRSHIRHYWVAHKEDGAAGNQGWAAAGGSALTSRELTAWLPATVLWEPK